MTPIVTFIGWHDSGKTTFATNIVTCLKKMGYNLAVIKSSKDIGLKFDAPDTDTWKHKQAGADSVLFVAPDQTVMFKKNEQLSLSELTNKYYSDMDIVIGEGFKTEDDIAKIVIHRKIANQELLQNQVKGVIAVVTDDPQGGDNVFGLDEYMDVAKFIQKKFLQKT